MKIKSIKYILGVLIFAFSLTSCSKNSDELASVENTKQDILTFATAQAFDSAQVKVNSMKPEDRVAWEKSKGFKSFGTICDEFYKTIEPQNFKTIEEINAFVASNSDKIQIYENNTGDKYCEVQEFDNSERYLMNKNKMYIVGTTVVRKFNEATVSTDIANLDVIKKAKNYSDLSTNITSFKNEKKQQKVSNATNPVHYAEEYTEGKVNDGWFGASQTYRLVVRFTAEYTNPQNHYQIQVSNYVWHIVLFGVSRLTSYNATMYTNDDNNYSPFFKTPILISSYWIQEVNPVDKTYDNGNSGVRITSYYVKASNDKKCSMERSVDIY